MKITDLNDLKLEDFGFTPEDTTKVPEYTDYVNGTYMVVSKVAFLAGVEKRHFENEHEPPKIDWYYTLAKDKNARIIRNLCILRTAIERNYKKINDAMRYDMKNLNSLPELIPQESLKELLADGISIQKSYREAQPYVIDINRHINNRINNCKDIFPIWLKWDYIKNLFIMPGGLTETGTKNAAKEYYANKNKYPYQVYMNWPGGEAGNILFSDKKFVQLLYEANMDEFWDLSKVTDAGNLTKTGIYRFLEDSAKTVLVVDCENSDPYKLYAALKNLDQEALLGKICKITLYDDVHTTNAWKILDEFTDIPVEHNIIERLKEEKSLVDGRLMVGACREFYRNDVDSFILLSSDSDYWSLISAMEEARFFVMVESEKCGSAIKKALVDSGISYCYIDDFCTGNSNEIKIRTVLSELRSVIRDSLQLNLRRALADALYDTRADMSESEQKQFYDRYLRKLRLEVDAEGNATLVLPD